MILLSLGIIIGLLVSILVFILMGRYQILIHRIVQKLMNSPIIKEGAKAYIAGLSDEESSFAESLNKKHDVHII